MKISAGNCAIAVLWAAGVAMGATVTVNSPAGAETNAFAFVTGDDSLVVNSGETGGTVHLNQYNTHTGGTTLGSGTLVVTKPAKAGEMHELGAGSFTQAGGTMRYTGPAGGVWTSAVTNNPASDSDAVVWQIDNDLVMAGEVQQPSGCFIKSGKGTLTFTQPFLLGGCTTKYNSAIYGGYTDFSPDRAPTKGYAPFTIADGTVVIDTPYDEAVTNVLSCVDVNLAIGQGTTTTGEETTGVLILSNGITRSEGRLNVGSTNGRKSNSTTRLQPTLRVVNGATLLVGPTGNMLCYLGVMWSDKTSQWNAPRLEVAGSGTKMYCKELSISYHKGADSTVVVSDGGDLQFYGGNLTISSNSGSADTTNEVIVTGSGSYLRCRAVNNAKTAVTNVRLLDGGVLEMWNFLNNGGGKLNLIVDGGIWRHRNKSGDGPHIPSTMTSVKVGPGGFHTYFNNGSEANPIVWNKGIEPLDDSGTDGGLIVTKGSSHMPPLLINAENTYCGPTEISFTRVYLGNDGRLPSGTALYVHSSYGGLVVTNGVQTVGSFQFGQDTATEGPILGFGPGSRLEVTGELHASPRLAYPELHLFETEGGTDGLATAGTYTYVKARAEDVQDLMYMAGQFTFPYKPDGVDYKCFVTVEDGYAYLKVAVTPSGTAATVSGDPLIVIGDTATTNVVSSDAIAAARTIFTNPVYDGTAGGVDLGAMSGFPSGGTLIAGDGFTILSDLSFVQNVSNLVLRQGTLYYTGASAEIPGFTIDTAANRSGVLYVENEDTTLTISDLGVVGGSITKMGPGTLHFGGTSEIQLPSEPIDAGAYNGMNEFGAGPANGARVFNVNGGKVEIGTVGDSTDAPALVSPVDFSVGSQSHRVGQGIQTTGELVMNNGSLYVDSYFYIGYYCGRYDDCPDLILNPTLTQNGGEVSYATLRMGHASASYGQTASPCLYVHAGTNTCRGTAAIGYSVVPVADKYRATVRIDGTGVMRVGLNVGCGWGNGRAAADLTVTDNGRLEVSNNLCLAYANIQETNTFHLSGNGTIRSRNLTGTSTSYGLNAYFDGGTYESLVTSAGNSSINSMQHAYIGAGGLNIDLSHQADVEGQTSNWLVMEQAFEHDPALGDTADGGITLRGAGSASTYTGFEESTFTGPIRLLDGARLIPYRWLAANCTVEAASGTRLFDYDNYGVVKNLTLGTEGSSDPVIFELRRDTASYGIVVTNTLTVNSPIAITTHEGTHDLSPCPVSGTYTALVYSASCADVDLSKFTVLASDAASATVSATQVTVADGGDFNGMKAVVVTIAGVGGSATANGNTWTSVSAGGTWSDSANWANAASGAPNGAQKEAVFNPATSVGVGVTLDEAVTLGKITLSANAGAKGYALSGQPLTLDTSSAAATPPAVVNESGTNTIASSLVLAKGSQLQTTDGNELRVTGGVTGEGDLEVNTHVETGAGQVNLKVASDFAGKVTTGSGRVVMDDLSFIQSYDQLTIGLGSFHYTGPDAEIPGFRFTAASGRPSVFSCDSTLTVNALERSGTAGFLKLGPGCLHLNGTDTMSVNTYCNNNGDGARYVSANGDGPTKAVRGFSVSDGTFVMGEVDDPDNAPTLEIGKTEIGIGNYTSPKNGSNTFVLNNGTITLTAQLYLSYYSTAGNMLTFRQNGGQIVSSGGLNCAYYGSGKQGVDTLFELNGGTAYFGSYLRMGSSIASDPDSQTCRIVVNDGSLAFAGPAYLAYNTDGKTSKAFVELNGGLFAVSNTVDFAGYADDFAELRLNPGATFRANTLRQTAESDNTAFYGNGGAYQPLTGQTLNAAFKIYSSTNGFVVDTSEITEGSAFTLAQPVLTDSALGSATDGGLVKRGDGTLVLSAANTYTGATLVEGGTLTLSGSGTLGTGSAITVASKAACDLGGTAQAIGSVTTSGLVGNGALTVTDALMVCDDILAVSGDLTLATTAAVDFAGRTDADLLAGEPIASVSGTATLPSRARATNAGDVKSVLFVRDGDMVYALYAPSGTLLLVR